ncbi:MAG: PH domain-containing protein [Myxococcota bacterium]
MTEPTPPAVHTLPPEARWLFHARALVGFAMGLGPATVAAAFLTSLALGPTRALIGGAIVLLAELLYTLWWPSLSYERFSWELRADALIVSSGVWWRERTAIPLGRVQHVDVRQGPLERWMSLSRVHVYTASGGWADGVVPAMRTPDAEGLRDELVARAGRGDDGV